MKKLISVSILSLLLIGCGSSSTEGSAYYCDTNQAECLASIDAKDVYYQDFCIREDSAICTQFGQGDPISSSMVSSAFGLLNENFTFMEDIEQYGVEDYWHANASVDINLTGDHEDKCITLINHLIYNDGNPKDIDLVASGIGSEVKHYYIKVNGIVYNKIVSYDDIFYMNMADVGTWKLMNQ